MQADTTLSDMQRHLTGTRQATVTRPLRKGEDMSMADNLKLIFTYVIVLVVVVGGGLMLYDIADNPGSETLSLSIVGFIGLSLGYVFNREAATQATRAAQSSSAQGADQGAAVPHQ